MADKNGNGVTGDIPIATVRSELLAIIRKKNQKATEDGFITREELKIARQEYIESILKKEKGELNKIDKQVVKSLVEHESIVKDIMQEKENLTVGQKLADGVAKFGGSWGFIISFGVFLIIWIGINSYFLLQKPYDPYPFILLNLILSCLAALQAPIIMMSQNRKDQKDRIRAENDYKINLKSELEIRHLHEKMDNLVQKQWQRLLEIQRLQLDIMEETQKERKKR
ncbi:MAG TPA: DUF1003 domain-containing protein [archaeon]|jgi:uncharacterized membrane protein|nr:DUF1003 domain-containing protein [archaeon]HOZ35977.1 DUF1003 domain-containing protein [archaeon]